METDRDSAMEPVAARTRELLELSPQVLTSL
ncbi:hypothetical protein RKD20_008583 [Streptomyces sp. SLBN-8D4]